MNDVDDPAFFSGMPTFMVAFFGIFLVIFVCIVAFSVVSAIRNWRALKKAGLDPMAAQGQLAGQLANSQLLAGQKSTEERLRELDDLRSRGVITEEEHRVARQSVLADG